MPRQATISSKGQVVIPKEIRRVYNLDKNTKVVFEIAKNSIIIKPLSGEFAPGLDEKLRNFEADPKFRSSWEKSLKKKLKKWNW